MIDPKYDSKIKTKTWEELTYSEQVVYINRAEYLVQHGYIQEEIDILARKIYSSDIN